MDVDVDVDVDGGAVDFVVAGASVVKSPRGFFNSTI